MFIRFKCTLSYISVPTSLVSHVKIFLILAAQDTKELAGLCYSAICTCFMQRETHYIDDHPATARNSSIRAFQGTKPDGPTFSGHGKCKL